MYKHFHKTVLVFTFIILFVGCSLSGPPNPVVQVTDIQGVQASEILVPGAQKYVYVEASGSSDLIFIWEDMTGVLQSGDDSILNYTVPNLPGSAFISVRVQANSVQKNKIVAFQIVQPTETPLPTLIPPTTTSTPAALVTAELTLTTEPTSDFIIATTAPTATIEPVPQVNILIEMVDSYLTCINDGNPSRDADFEKCWDMLSHYPGEIQSNLNKNDFIAFWKKFKVSYALHYCPTATENFVDADYYVYNRNDLSKPIGPYYLKYIFKHDENGWRIKGAESMNKISDYCETQPRIESTVTP